MKFFANCTTLDELKKAYKAAAVLESLEVPEEDPELLEAIRIACATLRTV